MLNPKTNQRELAYVVKIDEIIPIEGADRVETALVGGWRVMVRKDQFKKGDLAIYLEIDSKVPETEPFLFLASKNFKVKTQKYFKGKVISQGLLMSPEDFGWEVKNGLIHMKEDSGYVGLEVGSFLTKELNITYADAADNKRKANSEDKYKKMAQRNGKLFSKQPFRWLMKRDWGKKVLFVFFGRKKDRKSGWPTWVVKTDEERCQNMPWLFPGNPEEEWIATEKVDGTSTTFTMKDFGRKREFYICSRNVVFDKPEKECYYDTNVYVEMAEKYDIETVMAAIMSSYPDLEFVTMQGETYGEGIQKRDYGLKEHRLKIFNLIFGYKTGEVKRFNPKEMIEFLTPFAIPCIDIVDEHFIIPATCDELLAAAGGESTIDGGMREGLVFRSYDGVKSFKAVDNAFLLKYHG